MDKVAEILTKQWEEASQLAREVFWRLREYQRSCKHECAACDEGRDFPITTICRKCGKVLIYPDCAHMDDYPSVGIFTAYARQLVRECEENSDKPQTGELSD